MLKAKYCFSLFYFQGKFPKRRALTGSCFSSGRVTFSTDLVVPPTFPSWILFHFFSSPNLLHASANFNSFSRSPKTSFFWWYWCQRWRWQPAIYLVTLYFFKAIFSSSDDDYFSFECFCVLHTCEACWTFLEQQAGRTLLYVMTDSFGVRPWVTQGIYHYLPPLPTIITNWSNCHTRPWTVTYSHNPYDIEKLTFLGVEENLGVRGSLGWIRCLCASNTENRQGLLGAFTWSLHTEFPVRRWKFHQVSTLLFQ